MPDSDVAGARLPNASDATPIRLNSHAKARKMKARGGNGSLQPANVNPTFLRQPVGEHGGGSNEEAGVSATQGRSLRQLIGPVGSDYLNRAVPPAWVCAVLAASVGVALLIELPAMAAAALLASAVVAYWPQRRRPALGVWRLLGLAGLAAVAWVPEPDGLAEWFEHGLSLAIAALAGASICTHLVQARRLSRALQQAADGMDDQHLLALLPEEAAQAARQWRAGDDSRRQELAAVMHLAVMHAALSPQMRAGMLDA